MPIPHDGWTRFAQVHSTERQRLEQSASQVETCARPGLSRPKRLKDPTPRTDLKRLEAHNRSAGRALREVPFALPRNGTILEGFVDLVIETESGIEIVDWKTDDVSKAAIAERLKEYELQAGLYVLGIEEATQKTVRRVTYVFVRAGAEGSPGDPASLRASALVRLDEEARGVERE